MTATEKLNQYITDYLSPVQVSPEISKEYQQLIRDFLFSTGSGLYTMGYFKMESMEVVHQLPHDIPMAPEVIDDFNADPNFMAVKISFTPYPETNLYVLDPRDQGILKHYIREEFFNFFLSEVDDTEVHLNFDAKTESLIAYTICY